MTPDSLAVLRQHQTQSVPYALAMISVTKSASEPLLNAVWTQIRNGSSPKVVLQVCQSFVTVASHKRHASRRYGFSQTVALVWQAQLFAAMRHLCHWPLIQSSNLLPHCPTELLLPRGSSLTPYPHRFTLLRYSASAPRRTPV